jgi:hypothetical protein
MTAAAITAAVLAAGAIAVGIRLLHKAARLERLLEAHNRDEADLEAIADATRELPPWNDEQIERLRQAIEKDSEQ